MYLKVETFEINLAEQCDWMIIAKDNNMKEGVLYLIHDNSYGALYSKIIAFKEDGVEQPLIMHCKEDVIHTVAQEPQSNDDACKHSGGCKGAALVDPQFVLDLIREVKK
jgi:hypothetical protein